jgi:hypothetical protein
LLEGKPLPDQMVRAYAYVLDGYVRMRPLVAEHAPKELTWLDRLGAGTAAVLLSLQQPDGHFPFPDLRGKNLRFGDLTERALNAGQVEVRAGWVVSVDLDGGSQFDTGLAGAALLRAGQLRENAAWIAAGQRAADWALRQRCCANFNYNAFSVSPLRHRPYNHRKTRIPRRRLEKISGRRRAGTGAQRPLDRRPQRAHRLPRDHPPRS